MNPVDHSTCESHPGATCFRGGKFTAWTCPACELERLSDLIAREEESRKRGDRNLSDQIYEVDTKGGRP